MNDLVFPFLDITLQLIIISLLIFETIYLYRKLENKILVEIKFEKGRKSNLILFLIIQILVRFRFIYTYRKIEHEQNDEEIPILQLFYFSQIK